MKVKLLSYSINPEETCAKAMRGCRKRESAFELVLEKPKEYYINLARKTNHLSVIEHCSFTFSVKGISRVTTHQLVRHRIASYSQQSLRVVELKDEDWYKIPPSIKEKNKERFKTAMEVIETLYWMLRKSGIPQEDVRYMLPMGTKTNIVITMNGRELLHFFSLRLKPPAQWEIRELASKMLSLVKEKAPNIFEGIE